MKSELRKISNKINTLNNLNSKFTTRHYHEPKHTLYVNVNGERTIFEQTVFFLSNPEN